LKKYVKMPDDSMEKALRNIIAALIAVIIFGTFAYHILEGWPLFDCLYMTVITITTTGYKEVGEMGVGGRVLSMFLMFFGVGIFLYSIDSVIPVLIEKRKMRWKKMLKEIEDHYIICGYGIMGREISKELPKDKIVVIDIDPDKVRRARDEGLLAIQGDASEEEVLEKANVRKAKTLIACTSTDSANAFIVMTAKDLNPNIFTVVILRSPAGEKKVKRAGADKILSPYRDAARKICISLRRPSVADFIEIISRKGNVLMLEKLVVKSQGLVGKTLGELDLRKRCGCTVVAIERRGDLIIPDPETALEEGDVLYIVGKEDTLKKVEEMIS